MITKPPSSIRIFYMNINGTDQTSDEHSLLQLCSSLKTKDVDVICLTETNIDWNKPHLVNQLQRTLQKTWPKQKIGFYTSTSDLQWASNHKPGGTAMALLNNLS